MDKREGNKAMFDFLKRRLSIVWIIVVICGVSIINFKIQNNNILETSSELVNYEEQQLEKMKKELVVGERVKDDQESSEEANAELETSAEPKESEEEVVVIAQNIDETFEVAHSEIDMDRNKILSMLTNVIENREIDVESKNQATLEKIKIIGYINQEVIIENLLKNKGFEEAVVLITDNSVNITVEKSSLNKSDIAKILDIAMRETDRPIEQIIIQNKI